MKSIKPKWNHIFQPFVSGTLKSRPRDRLSAQPEKPSKTSAKRYLGEHLFVVKCFISSVSAIKRLIMLETQRELWMNLPHKRQINLIMSRSRRPQRYMKTNFWLKRGEKKKIKTSQSIIMLCIHGKVKRNAGQCSFNLLCRLDVAKDF